MIVVIIIRKLVDPLDVILFSSFILLFLEMQGPLLGEYNVIFNTSGSMNRLGPK